MRRGARTSKREARKAIRSAGSALNQLEPQVLDNPYPPLCPLTSDQVEEIHNASMTVLESLGMEVTSDRVRACLLYTSPSPRDLSTSRMPSSA